MDLIDRQAAIEAIMDKPINGDNADLCLAERCACILKSVPSAQKHGKWLDGYRRQECSICKFRGRKSWNYCPHCGAAMEIEE